MKIAEKLDTNTSILKEISEIKDRLSNVEMAVSSL